MKKILCFLWSLAEYEEGAGEIVQCEGYLPYTLLTQVQSMAAHFWDPQTLSVIIPGSKDKNMLGKAWCGPKNKQTNQRKIYRTWTNGKTYPFSIWNNQYYSESIFRIINNQ